MSGFEWYRDVSPVETIARNWAAPDNSMFADESGV
jgi:hypothetical protein